MADYIKISNLSKLYRIPLATQAMYSTLRESLTKGFKSVFRDKPSLPEYEKIWALKDIDLSIQEGDRVAIIGRNGAGKSTLLKILSKITSPTSGEIVMRGKVSSLLEVGTGFHPELTGKENIFLNGAILGMKRQEIARKFSEIVEFAGVEKFLDTPVKRYSSGMIARLGFAIAAHLDPDILIVDEVLAVGDVAFQAKCLKKMDDLGNRGRTVLFVSHDINSVLNLCNKGVFLDKGHVVTYGPIDLCVSEYMKQHHSISMHWQGDIGNNVIRFHKARLQHNGEAKEFFYQDEPAMVKLDYEIIAASKDACLGISVWNQRHHLLGRSEINLDYIDTDCEIGRRQISFELDSNLFHEGEYVIKLECTDKQKRRIIHDEISLKYPIYAKITSGAIHSNANKSGVSLGNRWQIIES